MAIITISRGAFSLGKTVAEKVAERLHYDIISREILLDASTRFNVSEIKLEKAIHDAPGILERYSHSKQSYVAYIRSALVERIINDNVVYNGLAGHLLLKGLPHVLKVRITANIDRRVAIEMERNQIPAQEARVLILEDDKQRRKWTQTLYDKDPRNSSLYDLCIFIDKLSVDNAVDFICRAAESEAFRSTDKNKQKVKDMATSCRVKATLVDEFPNIAVTCEYGNVLVYIGKDQATGKLIKKLNTIRDNMNDIYHLETHTGLPVPQNAV
jgi:cytidylate kinase